MNYLIKLAENFANKYANDKFLPATNPDVLPILHLMEKLNNSLSWLATLDQNPGRLSKYITKSQDENINNLYFQKYKDAYSHFYILYNNLKNGKNIDYNDIEKVFSDMDDFLMPDKDSDAPKLEGNFRTFLQKQCDDISNFVNGLKFLQNRWNNIPYIPIPSIY